MLGSMKNTLVATDYPNLYRSKESEIFYARIDTGRKTVTKSLKTRVLTEAPVSYTHLDVYKRQSYRFFNRGDGNGGVDFVGSCFRWQPIRSFYGRYAVDVYKRQPVDDLPELAFDHRDIIDLALERVRSSVKKEPALLYDMLPAKFTALPLRRLNEEIHGKPIDCLLYTSRCV